ncbi:RDD family protein [Curtobacterium sp. Leaf261]|uniref:RDD family protein n=1 Tax=Curtobacterium sp. Leaf261 TaxID=1736311 RepID=UPI0006FD0DEE|nr:RDD family protein [Curtobacterium sp. Leaf261]KQO64959.1 transporter [Curtobacterium sp. Leaf261]
MPSRPATPPGPSSAEWPGKDLGLPANGPRSVGRVGRRVGAIAIDWAIATVLCVLIGQYGTRNGGFVTLAVFAVLQIVFLALLSGSFGHVCVGLRVVPVRGGYIGVVRPIVRTVLLCVVIPAVIYDQDQRGLHDRAAGTVLVRR